MFRHTERFANIVPMPLREQIVGTFHSEKMWVNELNFDGLLRTPHVLSGDRLLPKSTHPVSSYELSKHFCRAAPIFLFLAWYNLFLYESSNHIHPQYKNLSYLRNAPGR